MKVLTLHQPYATLIALGVKTIETRPQAWTSLVGQRIAIHGAAKEPVPGLDVGDYYPEWDFDEWLIVRHPRIPGWWQHPMPLGAIVCTAVVTDSLPMLDKDDELAEAWMPHLAPTHRRGDWWHWKGPGAYNPSTGRPVWAYDDITDQLPYGDFRPGRFGLLLADVEVLPEPVPFKGGQGLSRSWDPA